MIPYARQDVSDEDVAVVVEVLRSDWLTQGPVVGRFEQAVAANCGASAGVAVSSGTAALHLACRALGLEPGDGVWTSPNSFVASANCARYCDCDVDFIDIDPKTYNLSVAALEEKLYRSEQQGNLPKAVIAVHFAGQSCDMEQIWGLSQKYGFKVIEDASHAIGGRYRDTAVGSCRYSDLTVFSFHPVKIITTAEGGMVMANDEGLLERLRLLRSHGIARDPAAMASPDEGAWYYEQIDLGYNYRMSDMQAALGLSQLNRLEAFVQRRRFLASQYDQALEGLPLVRPWQHPDCQSSYHLYPVQVVGGSKQRRELYDALHHRDIRVQVHYIPIHTQPYYRSLGFACDAFPEAESYYARTISLPMYPAMTDEDQAAVVDTLHEVL